MNKSAREEAKLCEALNIWYACYNAVDRNGDYTLADKEKAIDFITKALEAREKKGRGEIFLSNIPLQMALQKLRVGAVTRPDVKHFCELDKDEADAVRKEIEKLEPNYGKV